MELFQQAAVAGGLVSHVDDDSETVIIIETHGISSRLVAAVLAIGETPLADTCIFGKYFHKGFYTPPTPCASLRKADLSLQILLVTKDCRFCW